MKTKDEILKHLAEVGYKVADHSKICGFLIGNNIKDVEEVIIISTNGSRTFNDFYLWFNDKEEVKLNKKVAFMEILNFLKANKNSLPKCCEEYLQQEINHLESYARYFEKSKNEVIRDKKRIHHIEPISEILFDEIIFPIIQKYFSQDNK